MLANKLKIGDTIGVIAPDKALKNKDIKYLENATNYFESLGLKVKYGKYLFSEDNYCAGTPKERAKDLKDAVLFLEGFHSNIIQWNAMLEQYNQMNAFNKAIVFGYIYQLQQMEENEKMIVDELRKINSSVPVVKTNDFGHMHANSIIPIGAEVIINANNQSIVVSEYLK